jgi:cell division protein FtsZ
MDAVKQATTSPLLETSMENASHIMINVTGDISLIEANEAATYVQELAGESANIIFGANYDETTPDYCKITVIATGLEDVSETPVQPARPVFGQTTRPSQPAQPARPSFAQPSYSQPAPKPQPSYSQPAQDSGYARSNQESGIKIPDFLKNKR